MENGWNDDLFPVDETVDYYNKVRSAYPNQQMKLFYMDLGHNPRSATQPSRRAMTTSSSTRRTHGSSTSSKAKAANRLDRTEA